MCVLVLRDPGLDAFVDELTDGLPVTLADMGAGAGQVTYDDKMYSNVAEAGTVIVRFMTAPSSRL